MDNEAREHDIAALREGLKHFDNIRSTPGYKLVLDDIPTDTSSPKYRNNLEHIVTAYNKTRVANCDEVYGANDMWTESYELRSDLVDSLIKEDIDKLDKILQNFWRNTCSEHLIKYGTFADIDADKEYKGKYLEYKLLSDLVIWAEYTEKKSDIRRLFTPIIGNPYGIELRGTLITGCSTHHLRSADFIGALLRAKDKPKIAELGGGAGMLAYFLLRDIPKIEYTNFDLPEVLVLSQYLLMNTFPEKRFRLFGEARDGQDVALLPNFCIGEEKGGYDLFMNFHSLSEMRKDTVQKYLEEIAEKTDGYFFHENSILKQPYNETCTLEWNMPECFKLMSMHPTVWREVIYREYLYYKECK